MLIPLLRRAAAHLPSQCALCRQWQDGVVCADCMSRHPMDRPRCLTCALALPQAVADAGQLHCGRCVTEAAQGKLPLASTHAAVSYGFPWDGLIADFKFRDQTAWGAVFAGWLLQQAAVPGVLQSVRWILPLPLSGTRLRERGYNQANLLAQALAAAVPGGPEKLRQDMLLRVVDTPPQRGLDRATRRANLRHALAVDPLQAGALRGQPVLVVDDVMTSGASLHAAARVLREAGAGAVHAIVFARTEEDDFATA